MKNSATQENTLTKNFRENKDLYIAKAKSHAMGEDGMEKIYESDKFIALQPKNRKRSSIFWSNRTNWCTSTLINNRSRDYNHQDEMLVYVITKDKDLVKAHKAEIKRNFSKNVYRFCFKQRKKRCRYNCTMLIQR